MTWRFLTRGLCALFVGLVLAGAAGLFGALSRLRRRGSAATGVAEPEDPHAS